MDKRPIAFSFFMILAMFFFKSLQGAAVRVNLDIVSLLSFLFKFLFAYFVYTKVNTDNAKKITSQILGVMVVLFVGAYLVKDNKTLSIFTHIVFGMGNSFVLFFLLWAYLGQVYSLKSATKPYLLIIALSLLVPTLELANLGFRAQNYFLFFIFGVLSLGAALYSLQGVNVEQGSEEDLNSNIDRKFWFKLSLFVSFCAASVF